MFCAWKDKIEHEEEERRQGRGLGLQYNSSFGHEDIDDDSFQGGSSVLKPDSKSKSITKKPKFEVNRKERLSRGFDNSSSSGSDQNDDNESQEAVHLFKKQPVHKKVLAPGSPENISNDDSDEENISQDSALF